MADGVDEPLMGNGDETDLDEHEGRTMEASEYNEDTLRYPGLYVWLLTFSAGISGLLFGCESSSAFSRNNLPIGLNN